MTSSSSLTILLPSSVMTVTPELVDVDYIYLVLSADVLYDSKKTNLTAAQISDLVKQATLTYCSTTLNKFDSILRIGDPAAIKAAAGENPTPEAKEQAEQTFGEQFKYDFQTIYPFSISPGHTTTEGSFSEVKGFNFGQFNKILQVLPSNNVVTSTGEKKEEEQESTAEFIFKGLMTQGIEKEISKEFKNIDIPEEYKGVIEKTIETFNSLCIEIK